MAELAEEVLAAEEGLLPGRSGEELSQREIDQTIAWMRARIRTHPHELQYFK